LISDSHTSDISQHLMNHLPDVLILGETRCGTTTLCNHLASLSSASSVPGTNKRNKNERNRVKCYTPFCPWAHPELDHKESFYFVGHYLGIVDPYFYRMAFPLKLTRWWQERVLGNLFFCFDGCAQYLTSPCAPYLIASAYLGQMPSSNDHKYQNRGKELPPILVACVRNPVDQATSWWKYENNAITWGETMGLDEWNTNLRSIKYPPKSIGDAFKYSRSEFVEKSYLEAEKLFGKLVHHQCPTSGGGGHGSIHTGREEVESMNNHDGECSAINRETDGTMHSPLSKLSNSLRLSIKCMPPWAMTWPAGQLSSIGRSGCYASNIKRYNRVFLLVFGGGKKDASQSYDKDCDDKRNAPSIASNALKKSACFCDTTLSKTTHCSECTNQKGFVHIIPLESQSNGILLKSSLRPFLSGVVRRLAHRRQQPYSTLMSDMDNAVNKLCMGDDFNVIRRNSGTMLTNPDMEPTGHDLRMLDIHFEKDNKELEKMFGRKLCW